MRHIKKLLNLLIFFIFIGCGIPRGFPALQYFPDMYDSPAVEAQEEDVFGGTGGPRLPPVGSISQEEEVYEFASIGPFNDLPNGGLPFPKEIKKTFENYKRGEERYHIYCYPCHGSQGRGNGPVIGNPPRIAYTQAMDFSKAPATNMTDGQIYHTITKGAGQMPAYGAQIAPEDRWKIVLYVRKLQELALKSATNP
jgi:mono/diheme cytochrome c family protein